jgi:hypothetical protein
VAKELGIARDTVRKYLTESVPIRKETQPRARPVWDTVRERVEGLLTESARWTGGKQQLTATRLHELLVAEGKQVGVTVVKEAVAEWKRQRREVFVPLTYRPGDLAEVDFFEVLIDVEGMRRKAWLFLMRLMYSGRDFAWIYERQDQVSFLDGHVRAFAHFAGVPARLVHDYVPGNIIEVHDLRHAAEVAKRALVEPEERLELLIPDRFLVAVAGVAERHAKDPWPAPFTGGRVERGRAAEDDLALGLRGAVKHADSPPLGRDRPHEPLH